MKKTFVLDTNIVFTHTDSILKFEDNNIILPTTVVRELKNRKKGITQESYNARRLKKFLTNISKSFEIFDSPAEIIETGGTIQLLTPDIEILKEIENIFPGFSIDNDDKTMSVAIKLHREYINKKEKLENEIKDKEGIEDISELKNQLDSLSPVVLVSNDDDMHILGNKFKIPVEEFLNVKIVDPDKTYTGWRVLSVPDELIANYYISSAKISAGTIFLNSFFNETFFKENNFKPNEYVILVSENEDITDEDRLIEIFENTKTPVLKYNKSRNKFLFLNIYEEYLYQYNLTPKNIHQKMALDLLFDTSIPLKTIIGLAGTGKTLLALFASLQLTNALHKQDEILITRPPILLKNSDLGFLPGSEEEKMAPYLRSFQENLNFLIRNKSKGFKDKGDKKPEFSNYRINTESIGFFRGKTTFRQIMIIDEAQNGDPGVLKTALTRIGKESIVIVLGDTSQIDHPSLNSSNNGLTHTVELMKNEDLAGHVTLILGERSELSKLVAEKWDSYNNKK